MYWNYPYQAQVADYSWVSQRRERVYTEDLLERNVGKLITVYLTFENNPQWNAKRVTGTLRGVGRDFILVRDQQSGKDMVFHNINVDYVVFENQPAALAGEAE